MRIRGGRALAENLLAHNPETATSLGIDKGPRAALRSKLADRSAAGQQALAATLRADYLRRFADAQSVLDACLDAAGIRHARHYTDQPLDLPLRRLFGARDAAEYA